MHEATAQPRAHGASPTHTQHRISSQAPPHCVRPAMLGGIILWWLALGCPSAVVPGARTTPATYRRALVGFLVVGGCVLVEWSALID